MNDFINDSNRNVEDSLEEEIFFEQASNSGTWWKSVLLFTVVIGGLLSILVLVGCSSGDNVETPVVEETTSIIEDWNPSENKEQFMILLETTWENATDDDKGSICFGWVEIPDMRGDMLDSFFEAAGIDSTAKTRVWLTEFFDVTCNTADFGG